MQIGPIRIQNYPCREEIMRSICRMTVLAVTLLLCACGSPEQPPVKPAQPVAAQSADKGATVPDTVILAASEGQVTLPHRAHAQQFNCNMCHSEAEPGKIAWDMATAHAYCRDCHTRAGKGPITCTACHKK
jgi:hypothetical protein